MMAPAALAFDWMSLTSYSEARRMRVIGDTLLVVTSGGLLAVSDPDRESVQYDNLNGLGTVDVTDIRMAADGQKWVTADGRLIRFDGAGSVRFPIVDNDGNRLSLYCLETDNDFIWLGSEIGLILFSVTIDGGQIQDAFQLFANLNPSPTINDILLDGDSIWIATTAGLATADRTSLAALKPPANWRGFSVSNYPELGSDTILAVTRFEGAIYCGTTNGLFRFNPTADSFTPLPFAIGAAVNQLEIESDTLWVYSEAGLGRVVDSSVSIVATPGLAGGIVTGVMFQGRRWLGAAGDGLYYETDGNYIEYPYVGLPDNEIADVAVTSDGTLALLFTFGGPYLRSSGQWVHQPVNIAGGGLKMCADSRGQLYVASFGGGMSVIGDSVARYDAHNSTLQEATSVGSNFVVCYDMAVTDRYFFGANFEPRDDTRIAIGDLTNLDDPANWTSLGVNDGIAGEQVVSVDHYGAAIAVGSGLSGAYYYYLGADPFDRSDDSVVNYNQSHLNFRYRIISDVVRVVRFSPDGELWVGTNFGISRFDLGFESFIEVTLPPGFGPDITDIEFDSRGNVWIGAKNGLARIIRATGETEVYTCENSGLINDQVERVTFDTLGGDLYVATGTGLSTIPDVYGAPAFDVNEVIAFPNPFVINSADDRLGFNFAGNGFLRIFDVAGELVYESTDLIWDGRNGAGNAVASGVYLFVLTDTEGAAGQGKFLLVRH